MSAVFRSRLLQTLPLNTSTTLLSVPPPNFLLPVQTFPAVLAAGSRCSAPRQFSNLFEVILVNTERPSLSPVFFFFLLRYLFLHSCSHISLL